MVKILIVLNLNKTMRERKFWARIAWANRFSAWSHCFFCGFKTWLWGEKKPQPSL